MGGTIHVEVDLQDLHEFKPRYPASELLRRILDAYEAEYEVLVNCSPDVGVEYYTDDDEFKKAFGEVRSWLDEAVVVEEYAKKRKARAVVELFDGYEWAYALVF